MKATIVPGWVFATISCFTLLGCSVMKKDFRNISAEELKQAREIVIAGTNSPNPGEAQLKGVKTVTLALDYLQDYKKGVRPSESQIMQPISRKLRMAGLKVVPFEEITNAQDEYFKALTNNENPIRPDILQDMPLIQQEIKTFKWVNNSTVVSIQTLVFEDAVLKRDMSVKQSVVTWKNREIETDVVENRDLSTHILKVSMDQIDKLLDDWLRQNGR